MAVIKSVDLMSMVKLQACIAAAIGLLLGLFGLIFGALLGPIVGMGGSDIIMSLASLIILPITYAIGGAIAGAVTAFVYNIVAEKIGGLQLEIEK